MDRRALLARSAAGLWAASARAQQACFDRMDCFDTQIRGPSLDLQFTAGVLDPRITFTRADAASCATYVNAAGTLTTVAANVARFGFDPVTHASLGLLIEEARTNLLLQSGNLANAAWSATGLTVTGAAAVAPDGTTTATLLTETVANSAHILTQTPPVVTAGQVFTFSIYLKASGGFQPAITSFGEGTANINLNTGTISGTGATITPAGNGWYRCAQTYTKTSTTATVFIGTTGNFGAYVGSTGNSVYAWGAQWELSPFPTSYVATTAAAVTRAADVATMVTGSWFNSSAGSLAAVGSMQGVSNPSIAPVLAELDDGTITNALNLRVVAGTTNFAASDFVANALITNLIAGSGVASGVTVRGALAYGAGSLGAALNGAASVSASVALPSGITNLSLGAGRSSVCNGYLSRVRYWPRALSGPELQAVTQ